MQAVEDKLYKSITPREWEFLELLAKGLSNRSIASKLFIEENSVQDKSRSVYAKLGFSSRLGVNPRVSATLWYWGITANSVRNGNI